MSKMIIKFDTPEDIQQFVNIVENYPYEMDLVRGKFIVDAKSLLGIMNLGVNNEITLNVYSEICDELKTEISQYIAA
ncbi:MAG: HPr family phosphocarrier protein [Eubacteriales bacterium]